MNADRWNEVVAIFDKLLELLPSEREHFLAEIRDDELRRQVESMLRFDAGAHPLLDATPDELAAAVALAATPALEGQRIGPYVLVREVGRGGMGTVYLAERADVEMRVALKLVAGGLASPARTERFLFERRVLARLEHPNIARMLDAGIAPDGTPWLAMEYVQGERIDEWCKARGLGVRERLVLFEKVCDAVAYAHRNLVVHRDLKPSNILVTAEGEPRLVDFGIAKLLEDTTDTSQTLTVAGARALTPEYASPEQLRGDAITTASDVYQLGVLMFQLLTGRLPQRSSGQSLHELQAVNVGDRDVENIVRKAMDPEPDRRYDSAKQLREDVERYLGGHPIIARAPTLRYRAAKFVRRHRASTAMAAGIALMLIVSSAITIVQARRVARERDRAEQVSDLLAEIFASSDPTVSGGDSVTARAVLDDGAERVRSKTGLDPEVRAELMYVIGVAYGNLGALRRSVELHSEAVSTLQDIVPPDHPALLRYRVLLGAGQAELGQLAEAIPSLEDALARERRLRPRRRPELAKALHSLAYAKQIAGDFDTARQLYEEALTHYRTLPDSLSSGIETTLTNLGYLARVRGDLDAAESLFREALDRRRALEGDSHPLTARSMITFAQLLIDRDKLDEAERLADEAFAIHRRTLTAPHQELAEALVLKAELLRRRGNLAEAEKVQREAVAMYTQVYGAGNATVAHATADLAGIVQGQGRLNEAAQLHRDAAERYSKTVGDNHTSTAITLTNLAYTEFLRRRLEESEALYRRALPVLDSASYDPAGLSTILADFAFVLILRGKSEEAVVLARRSVELARTRWPETHGNVIRPQRTLGGALVNLRRFEEAEPVLIDAHRKLVQGFGATNQFTIDAASDLVRFYELWGKKAEADRYRRVSSEARTP
jgi:serine/threonine-protein kinase